MTVMHLNDEIRRPIRGSSMVFSINQNCSTCVRPAIRDFPDELFISHGTGSIRDRLGVGIREQREKWRRGIDDEILSSLPIERITGLFIILTTTPPIDEGECAVDLISIFALECLISGFGAFSFTGRCIH
jgi:hypothetical protein